MKEGTLAILVVQFFCWVKGELRVVGVATQKHLREILTSSERQTIEGKTYAKKTQFSQAASFV